jgi:hypothetical protein
MRTFLASVSFLLLGSGLAAAEEREKDCAAQRRGNPNVVCQVSIEGDTIERELPKWLDETIVARNPAEHGSLIRWRTDFLDRIVRSADEI